MQRHSATNLAGSIIVGVASLSAFWLLVRAIDIIGQAWVLNDDILEEEKDMPTQSKFLLLVYYVMLILVSGLSLLLVTFSAATVIALAMTVDA